MIKYINGDILETDCRLIIHGCNSQGKMGTGVALAIRNKYPEVYKEYKDQIEYAQDNFLPTPLGYVIYVETNDGHHVVGNALTQEFFGYGKRFVSYDAIDTCFRLIYNYCKISAIDKIATSKIGAVNGGGNWNIIEKIIEENMKEIEVVVYQI